MGADWYEEEEDECGRCTDGGAKNALLLLILLLLLVLLVPLSFSLPAVDE